jgi:hypothetical protein
MKDYSRIVRDNVWAKGAHNFFNKFSTKVGNTIRNNVWNPVMRNVNWNIRNNVDNTILYNHNLFQYNHLQQYKDNL